MHGKRYGSSSRNTIAGTRQEYEQHKALVFDGNIRYDLILGADFLTKSGIDI